MLVNTIKKHWNTFGDTYEKVPPQQYEVPDEEGANLIAAGLVEEAKAEEDPPEKAKSKKGVR